MGHSRSRVRIIKNLLDPEFPGLAAALAAASPEKQRATAVAAARLAIIRTRLRDRRISAVDALILDDRFGASPERQELERMALEMDGAAWALHERAHEGPAAERKYMTAFQAGRAAAAMVAALGEDPLTAAYEAVYEAHNATADPAALRHVLDGVLGLRPQ